MELVAIGIDLSLDALDKDGVLRGGLPGGLPSDCQTVWLR